MYSYMQSKSKEDSSKCQAYNEDVNGTKTKDNVRSSENSALLIFFFFVFHLVMT